jgi:hypothetical protein
MGVPYSHISTEEQQKNREFNVGGQRDMPLTEQEYVNKLGLACPNCYKTEGVDAWDRAEVDDGVAWQNISCSLCEANWVDIYYLAEYADLETPDNDSTK